MNNDNKVETSYAIDDIVKVSGSASNFLLIRRKLKLYTSNNQL